MLRVVDGERRRVMVFPAHLDRIVDEHACNIKRHVSHVDRRLPLLDKQRQCAAVIQVRMRENRRIGAHAWRILRRLGLDLDAVVKQYRLASLFDEHAASADLTT